MFNEMYTYPGRISFVRVTRVAPVTKQSRRLTFGERVNADFHLREVSVSDLASEPIEADPLTQHNLLLPSMVFVESSQNCVRIRSTGYNFLAAKARRTFLIRSRVRAEHVEATFVTRPRISSRMA